VWDGAHGNQEKISMMDHEILLDALKFHGHRCWTSVVVVRCGR
jgi:hypothetical protein